MRFYEYVKLTLPPLTHASSEIHSEAVFGSLAVLRRKYSAMVLTYEFSHALS